MPQQQSDEIRRQAEVDDEQPFFDQLRMMKGAFVASPVRNKVLLLSLAIVIVIVATAIGQVVLNQWYKPFYDTLENRNFPGFLHQLVVFAEIAGVLLVLNVLQTWLGQWVRVKLREGLTLDLVGEWMKPGRAFRLANAGAIGINPDQRIHEDAGHLTDLTAGLSIGLLEAVILLVSFVGVLWSLSSGFAFHIAGYDIALPGYMVWAVLLYAGTAACVSWFVGRPLVKLNGAHYSREAVLRSSLMRANEHIEAVSLSGGEAGERRRIETDLRSVLDISSRLMMALTRLTWVTSGYGWITIVAPIIIAAPVYFAGNLSFGGLMMAVGAFNQVNTSLRWFVDNFNSIADWRATLLRVAAFRSALLMTDERHEGDKRITFTRAADDRLTIDHLEIIAPNGSFRLSEDRVEIKPGDRVLVTAAASVDKAPLFRALAGLWPWGHGQVSLPPGENMIFVPHSPYFSSGTLAEVLSNPRAPDAFAPDDMRAILIKVGLGKLKTALDQDIRRQLKLTEAELRLLAIARAGLHKPQWVIMDEAMDALDNDAYHRLVIYLEKELGEAAILNIGRRVPGEDFFTRVIVLESNPSRGTLRLLQPKSLRHQETG